MSQHAGVADTVRKSSGQWNGHAQLAISWLIDREQVAGVAAACELLKTVSIILSISLGRFHLPLGTACTNDTVKNIFSAQECHDQSRSLSWSQRSGQASGRSVMVSHVNSGIAPTQDRDNPLCYKISMEGSGDTGRLSVFLAQVNSRPLALHTGAETYLTSRLDLEGYLRLATLAGSAISIRLFRP